MNIEYPKTPLGGGVDTLTQLDGLSAATLG